MSRVDLDLVLDDGRRNAWISWLLTALLVVVGLEEVAVRDYTWAVFAFVVAGLAVAPAIAHWSVDVMLPWEVLLMAALPVVGLALGSAVLTGHFASYLAVAAVALVVAVELHTFTTVRMSSGFAVVFVVVATLASAGLWALVRFASDVFLDTALVTGHDEVMWEFVYSALAGVGAGFVFELYFRRFVVVRERVPEGFVSEVVDADE